MNVTVSRKNLLNAVRIANKTIKNAPKHLPTVHCVHLYVNPSNGELHVRATNLDAYVDVLVPCTATEPGECLLECETLLNLLRATDKAADVHIITDNCDCTAGDHGKAMVNDVLMTTFYPEDFPEFPKISDGIEYQIGAAELKNVVDRLSPVVNKNDIYRQQLQGIIVSNDQYVATDGTHLATIEYGPTGVNGIIPIQTAQVIGALCALNKTFECTVNLSETDKMVQVTINGSIVISRLIEGQLPAYRDLLPSTDSTKAAVTCDPKVLSAAVSRAMVGLEKDKPFISLETNDSTFWVSSETVKNDVVVSRACYGRARITVDGTRLLRALKTFKDKKITVCFHADGKPYRIESGNHQYWCMPCLVTKS